MESYLENQNLDQARQNWETLKRVSYDLHASLLLRNFLGQRTVVQRPFEGGKARGRGGDAGQVFRHRKYPNFIEEQATMREVLLMSLEEVNVSCLRFNGIQ